MKKVLFVATVVKKHINQFHIPYLKWFHDQGFEVHVFAKNDYDNVDDCVIPFCDRFFDSGISRNPLSTKNIRSYLELKKLINSNQYTLIHCHTPVGGMLTRLAARKARKNGTKVLYTAHGFHFYKGAPLQNWLIYYPIERVLAHFTDAIITINNEDYERAQKFKCKIFKTNGIGYNSAKLLGKYDKNFRNREELNLNQDDFVLISIGELIKRKNHLLVLKYLTEFKNPKIKYLIVGDGKLMFSLKKYVQKYNLESQVYFIGYTNNLKYYFDCSDLFVFPSYQEGMPIALLESIYYGLPVICSLIRGATDFMINEYKDFLFDPNSTISLQKSILFFRNSIKDNKFYNLNLKREIQKFEIKNVMKEIIEIYENIL